MAQRPRRPAGRPGRLRPDQEPLGCQHADDRRRDRRGDIAAARPPGRRHGCPLAAPRIVRAAERGDRRTAASRASIGASRGACLSTRTPAGIAATIACAALLVGAVGITWYGPPRAEPALLVNTGTGSVCGSVAGVSAGILML